MKIRHPEKWLNIIAVSLFTYLLIIGINSYFPRCKAIEVPNYHQAGDSILPPEPEEPPPEDGRSVYDPEIYNKWQGLPFTDVIPAEPHDEEEGPVMPSYPWRGGGHEPMPLSDPTEDKRKTEANDTEVIIGYISCKKVQLDDFEDDWEDLEEEMEKEENEDRMESNENQETSGDEAAPVSSDDDPAAELSGEVDVDDKEGNEGSGDTKEGAKDANDNFALMKSNNIFGVGANEDFVNMPQKNKKQVYYPPLQRTADFLPSQLLVNKSSHSFPKKSIKRNLHSNKYNFWFHNVSPYINFEILQEKISKIKIWNNQDVQNKSKKKRSKLYNFEKRMNNKQKKYLYRKLSETGYHPSTQSTTFDTKYALYPGECFQTEDPSYVPHMGLQRSLKKPKLRRSPRSIRSYFLPRFQGVAVEDDSKSTKDEGSDATITGNAANVPDSNDESSTETTTGIQTESWDENKPAELETRGDLTYEQCEQCLPCCAYFFRRDQDSVGVSQYIIDDECKPDDRDLDNPSAECRTCHVRRRPVGQGVTLTCYECAGQQGDKGCRLGPRNPETSQYRVSARFFTISSSNETTTTATQANSMLARRPYFFVPQEGMESPIENSDEGDYEDDDAEGEEDDSAETEGEQ